jgi:hypothetical protein
MFFFYIYKAIDIDSEESALHALNIICDTDKDNDEFCVDFMDEEDNWREVFLLSERDFFFIYIKQSILFKFTEKCKF